MNDTIHEPKFVTDAKNAVGYFIVLSFVSCGVVFIFGGMFCPLIWLMLSPQRWEAWTLMWQETEKEHGKTVTLDEARKSVRQVMGWLFAIWFVLGWGLFIVAHMTYMNNY